MVPDDMAHEYAFRNQEIYFHLCFLNNFFIEKCTSDLWLASDMFHTVCT